MEKLRRTPFRCRGCHKRFYVFIPRDKDDLQEIPETGEAPETRNGHSGDEPAHKPDAVKPAEP